MTGLMIAKEIIWRTKYVKLQCDLELSYKRLEFSEGIGSHVEFGCAESIGNDTEPRFNATCRVARIPF